jgi:hypothetical protein
MKYFFNVLFFLIMTVTSMSATYYVRPDGNNSNSGTADTAGSSWRNIQFALNAAQAGDTINVAAGNYDEILTTVRSGSVNSRITVQCNGTVNFGTGTPSSTNTTSLNINHSYITFIGGRTQFCVSITANYIELKNTEIYGERFAEGAVRISAGADNGLLDGLYIHDIISTTNGFRQTAISMMPPSSTALPDGSDAQQSWVIQNCLLKNVMYHGMELNGIGHLIQNNKLDQGSGTDSFRVFGQNHIIRRNFVFGVYPSTIGGHVDFIQSWGAAGSVDESVIWSKNILVEENLLYWPMATATVDLTFANTPTKTITRSSGSWIADGFDNSTSAWMRSGLNAKQVSVASVTDTVLTTTTNLTAGTSTNVKIYGNPGSQTSQLDEGNPNSGPWYFNRNVFVNVMGAANNQGFNYSFTNNTFVECGWNVAHIGAGTARSARSRFYFQSIPNEGETVTLDTLTYTWKTIADETLEIQIGNTIQICRNAFYNAVMGLDGINQPHPTLRIPSKVNVPNWSNNGSKTDTNHLIQVRGDMDSLAGLAGNGKITSVNMAATNNYFTQPVTSYGANSNSVFKNNIFYGCGRSTSDNDPSRGWYTIANRNQATSFTIDYNFVSNLNYTPKAQGSPGNNDSFKFYEPNGINGGNPLFVNVADPVGPDGLIFTADDGLRLLAESPLLGEGEGGADIGAYGVGAAITLPTAPSELSVISTTYDAIQLTWTDNSTNENYFELDRSINGSSWTTTQISSNTTTHAATGLNPSTLYYFRLRAVNGDGNSAYTATVSSTTQAAPPVVNNPPIAPTNFQTTAIGANSITMAWDDNSADETGFEIEGSPNGTAWLSIATLGPNVESWTNSGLVPATTYYYRVRAVNQYGNSAWSNDDATTTAASPPPRPARAQSTRGDLIGQ